MFDSRIAARPRVGLVVAVFLVAMGALTACSSPAASSPEHTVTITGNSFGDDFTIPAGSAVVFVNNAGLDHTVTNGVDGQAVEDPLFDVQLGDGQTSEPIRFDEPGTYDVTCRIHPSMQLTITVE